ncbi:MAG: hypothetical protein GY839_08910, partial [candidate division Zixibacteria bacterium]|nr:hypothetical protein [candidate division Zixibacteria bacterium]
LSKFRYLSFNDRAIVSSLNNKQPIVNSLINRGSSIDILDLNNKDRYALEKLQIKYLEELKYFDLTKVLKLKNYGNITYNRLLKIQNDLKQIQGFNESKTIKIIYELNSEKEFRETHLNQTPLFKNYSESSLTTIKFHETYYPHEKIINLNLSTKAIKTLQSLNISTIGELLNIPGRKLIKVTGFGIRTLNDLRHTVKNYLFIKNDKMQKSTIDYESFETMLLSLLKLAIKSKKDRNIIALRLGLDRGIIPSLSECAKRFNITRERARQIESKYLDILSSKYFYCFLNIFWNSVYKSSNINNIEELGLHLRNHFRWIKTPNKVSLSKLLILYQNIITDYSERFNKDLIESNNNHSG